MISKKLLKIPKTNPQILSKINTPFISNLGDNQLEIMVVKINAVINGKPKARISTTISWDMCSNNFILNLSKKLNAIIKDKIQEKILKNSLTKPLKVATKHEVRTTAKTIMSIILKYKLFKNSISLYYLYQLILLGHSRHSNCYNSYFR